MKRLQLLLFLILNVSGVLIHGQITLKHQFSFQGFSITIKDGAADSEGNHLFVGELEVENENSVERDTMINRIFSLENVYEGDDFGILILTDENDRIKQIKRSFHGRKVVYDSLNDEFIIGSIYFMYTQIGEEHKSIWQPVIIRTNTDLIREHYILRRPYSCILEEMQYNQDTIKLFTRSDNNEILENEKERVERFTISTARSSADSVYPWMKALDPIDIVSTPFEDGSTSMSNVVSYNEADYFCAMSLYQFGLQLTTKLYRIKNNALKEIEGFSQLLEYAVSQGELKAINGFYIDDSGEVTFMAHRAGIYDKVKLIRTTINFDQLNVVELPAEFRGRNSLFFGLDDGRFLVGSIDKNDNWFFQFFDDELTAVKRTNTEYSDKYKLYQLKANGDNHVQIYLSIDQNEKAESIIIELPIQ